jgi:hypothetical protein
MDEIAIQTPSLRYDNPSKTATSFKVGNSFYPAPAYIPEIKGEEDLTVLLENMHVIPAGNPILIPANRWANLVQPLYFQKRLIGSNPIQDFIQNYSLIFYDPPEFFKGIYGEDLLEYALSGRPENKKSFKVKLKNKDLKGAMALIPPFFQPFVEAQLLTISKALDIQTDIKRNGDVYRAWLDPRISDYYRTYITNNVKMALKSPNSTIIPPVPQLRKDTPDSIKRRILSSNRATSRICYETKEENRQIFPYFHLYIDLNIFDNDDQNNQNTVFSLLNDGITHKTYNNYSGVALTLVGYESSLDKYRSNQLKNFISEIVNICHEKTPSLPVILLRSSWYGLYFADYGIQAFSSLLNGNLKYSQGSGGTISPNDRFGKVPIIDLCIDVDIEYVKNHLSELDEFPQVEGLPTIPQPEYFKNEMLWRTKFSKPLRLIHIEEGKRIRKSTLEGTINPSKHYFSKSKHRYLQDL